MELASTGVGVRGYLLPTGWKYTNMDRLAAALVDLGASTLASGTLKLIAVELPAGLTVAKLGFRSGATALGGGSNQWFCLLDSAFHPLAITSDDTSTAWAANTLKSLNCVSSYVVTKAQLGFAGIMVNATTPPSLQGVLDADSTSILQAPALSGNSTTALTTPSTLPNPAAAPAGAAAAVLKPLVYLG